MSRSRLLPPIVFLIATALLAPALPAQSTGATDVNVLEFADIGPPRLATTVTARFANAGSYILSTDVVFYHGDPLSGNGVEFFRTLVSINASNFVTVTTPNFDLHEGDIITACVDPEHRTNDTNIHNNCVSRVSSEKGVDVGVSFKDISVAPVGVNVGEPVKTTAILRNYGTVSATTVARLWHGQPTSPNPVLLSQSSVAIPPGGASPVSWTVNRPAGDTNFWVSLEDTYPRDSQPKNDLASRNLFLKAVVDTGRTYGTSAFRESSPPAVGDLLGTGQPVMVFSETVSADGSTSQATITAVELFADGTTKELWHKLLLDAPSQALAPAIADLDGDGKPEIIVEAVKETISGVTPDGEIDVFALNADGSTKWHHSWKTIARNPCHTAQTRRAPALGDMNGDGVVDVTILEQDLVVLDGHTGGELVRAPGIPHQCAEDGASAILDLDGAGKNSLVTTSFGLYVFNNDGTIRWHTPDNNIYDFAALDVDHTGNPSFVIPVHRQEVDTLDARTGAVKGRQPNFIPFDETIAASTSILPAGALGIIVSQNDSSPATAMLDASLQRHWFSTPNIPGGADNPQYVALADLLGQGRPQIVSNTNLRVFRLQDSKDGSFLLDTGICGGAYSMDSPIPVDIDGDGRGEVIVGYGSGNNAGTCQLNEVFYPEVNYLVFGSVHWKKLPTVWNQRFFQPAQINDKLAFLNDYQPWKSSNSWRQQPLRKLCDADFNNVVDLNDITLIDAAKGTAATEGDVRDADGDGMITVADARACALKCTLKNCGIIPVPGRILSVSPRDAFPGTTTSVTIRGEFLNFSDGSTTASFGDGVSVGGAQAGAFGPVHVLDANTAVAQLNSQPGLTGTRSVSISTGAKSASRPDAFALSQGAAPPIVSAGGPQTVILPDIASLNGSVPANLSTTWQQVAGPGVVTFTNAASPITTASFSQAGFYILRLSTTDGRYVASDDAGVTVSVSNQAPVVSAGGDRTTILNSDFTVYGNVVDDGLPTFAPVASQWTQISGPAPVTFATPNSPVTGVKFTAPGAYVLQLTANDSRLSGSAKAALTVAPPLAKVAVLNPNSAAPGQTRQVTITGQFTNFVNGTTQASFGPDVAVGGAPSGTLGPVTVLDIATATAQIAVASGATLGLRDIIVKTGSQQATALSAFTIGAISVPNSIALNLSDVVVAPAGNITTSPQVLDAGGNVISNPAYIFGMTVTPVANATTGNAPVVKGLTVSFPKLAKRILNPYPDIDPNGDFAGDDPTDPNYGKETGGAYQLTVTLQGSPVANSTTVFVLPSGTAAITLATGQYGGQLSTALAQAKDAMNRSDYAAINAASGQLAAIQANTQFNADVLGANSVLAPPDGFPVTLADLPGFGEGPDDVAFGRVLDSLSAQITTLTFQVSALNLSNRDQSTIDSLTSAVTAYTALTAQLKLLKPSPQAVTQNSDNLNKVMIIQTPELLDAITAKSAAILAIIEAGQPATASLRTTREELSVAAVDDGVLDTTFTFFSTLFAPFTDLAGSAKANIYELAISLASDLVSIEIANKINDMAPDGLSINFVSCGGQFSFVCPNLGPAVIDGNGFSTKLDTHANRAVIIGCVNSQALRNLITLKPPPNLGADVRLFNKIVSLEKAVGRDQSTAATALPDLLQDGLFEGSTELVFNNGFQRVNQGRLPCVGVVIVMNFETGSFQAINENMLPDCSNN